MFIVKVAYYINFQGFPKILMLVFSNKSWTKLSAINNSNMVKSILFNKCSITHAGPIKFPRVTTITLNDCSAHFSNYWINKCVFPVLDTLYLKDQLVYSQLVRWTDQDINIKIIKTDKYYLDMNYFIEDYVKTNKKIKFVTLKTWLQECKYL